MGDRPPRGIRSSGPKRLLLGWEAESTGSRDADARENFPDATTAIARALRHASRDSRARPRACASTSRARLGRFLRHRGRAVQAHVAVARGQHDRAPAAADLPREASRCRLRRAQLGHIRRDLTTAVHSGLEVEAAARGHLEVDAPVRGAYLYYVGIGMGVD